MVGRTKICYIGEYKKQTNNRMQKSMYKVRLTMKKIMFVFGTRPEAIKMAPLVKAMEKSSEFTPIVLVTAQHREMLELFNIVPDYDLNLMKANQTLTDITVGVLRGVERIVIKEKPDMVLVHGDTTTTFGGALAGFYQQVPVGHVEAGLRTYDKYSLPTDWGDFIKDITNIISQEDETEIFKSSVYNRRLRRKGEYNYLTDDESIQVGDEVEIPVGVDNHVVKAKIADVNYYYKEEAPYPIEKTKKILRKV